MPSKRSVALVVVAISMIAVSGCGKSGDKSLLSSSNADSLRSDLDRIDQLAGQSRCPAATDVTDALLRRIQALPQTTDSRLREALVNGAQQLRVLTNDPACATSGQTTTETQTQTVETQPTKTEPTKTQTVETTTTEKTPTTATPDTGPPQENDGSGGASPPGSNQAPGPAGEGGN